MENTPEGYTPRLFRRIEPRDVRYQYQEETEEKVLDRHVVGSVSTGIHAWVSDCMMMELQIWWS